MIDPASRPSVEALRARIGWLCQLLRFAAPAYATWVFVLMVFHWSDPAAVARLFASWLRIDIGEVPSFQRAAGFLVQMVPWGLLVGACVNLWLLFSGFLAGRVFTLDAALTLRRLALFGLAAQLADILARPILTVLMTIHLPPGSRHVGLYLQTTDLLDAMLLGGLFALAQVFKVAAEIADEHAAIV